MANYGVGNYGEGLYGAATVVSPTVQGSWPPRVLVTVTGLIVGDVVTLYRSVGGVRTAVRDATAVPVTDVALVRTDAELPFGAAVTYVLAGSGDDIDSAPTTYPLPGGKVALSDAIGGGAAEVTILAWPTRRRERKATTYTVGGRNVVVAGGLAPATSSIQLFVESESSRANVIDLLEGATSGVVQVRQPGGYATVDSYLAVTAVAEDRWSQDGSDERRTITLEVTEVEPWAASLDSPGTTLQDVADAYYGLTLADLAADYATLLLLAQADFS